MPLTLADYISLVKAYLADSRTNRSNLTFPDSDIIGALNQAQNDFCIEIGATRDFFRKTQLIDLVAGNMTLPEDFLGGLGVTYIQSPTNPATRIRMTLTTLGEMDDQNCYWRSVPSNATPQKMVFNIGSTGATIYSYPQPPATQADALFLNYIFLPTEMSDDTDESEVMIMFPSLQRTCLPFGALRHLTMFTGGADDDQTQKYESMWSDQIVKAHRILNGIYRGSIQLRAS